MLDTSRTDMLIGPQGTALLREKRVAVFGIGGVGGHTAEALARAGVGALCLIDADIVTPSNLNRQVVALHSTLGQPKTDVMAARIRDINPGCHVQAHRMFYLPENADTLPLEGFDYVADAVDTVAAKLEIIRRCAAAGVPVASAMGAGNKLRPECFEVAPIERTSVCPLARVMRRELKKLGIAGVRVVYSKEPPRVPAPPAAAEKSGVPGGKTSPPGSISFVPAAAGLVLAGEVVRGLLGLPEA